MDSRQLLDLIREVATLEIMRDFLRSRGLAFSAPNWDELVERRILPAIASRKIAKTELIDFLGEIEEFGRQHVFLYSTTPSNAKLFADKKSIQAKLSKQGLDKIFDQQIVVAKPKKPQFTAVIREKIGDGPGRLVIKITQIHEYEKFIGESVDGNFRTRKYEAIAERVVDSIRLSPDGLLEIRIARRGNSSDYEEFLAPIRRDLKLFFPIEKFSEVSLTPVKNKLWHDKSSIAEKVRFSDSLLRNDYGVSLKAATSSIESDLATDHGAVDSLDSFLTHDGNCDEQNIWFKANAGGLPDRDLHVLLKGRINEYVLPARCDRAEYEYILNEIRFLNS